MDADGSKGDITKRRELLRAALVAGATPWIPEAGRGRVSEATLEAVAETVAHAQRSDDRAGGAALGFVTRQAHAVERMLRHDSYAPATGRELSRSLAQLAQTAGFMEHDAGDDGRARAWYRFGAHAARHAEDPALLASILGLASNQAALCGRPREAVDQARAAEHLVRHAPPLVRALVHARGAPAAAPAGDLCGVHRQHEKVLRCTQDTDSDGRPLPGWVSYVSTVELDAIVGRSLVTIAPDLPAAQRAGALDEAEDLLSCRALGHDPAFNRSGLRHALWLALAHAHSDRPDQAATAARRALDRLPTVHSTRSLHLLTRLHHALTPHQHTPEIHTLRTSLLHAHHHPLPPHSVGGRRR